MSDPKFGYNWIWFIPCYYAWQVYLYILEKWFPRKCRKVLGITQQNTVVVPTPTRYVTFSYYTKLSLVQDPFNTWLAGKTLVQDNMDCSVVAWFSDKELARTFCKLLNETQNVHN